MAKSAPIGLPPPPPGPLARHRRLLVVLIVVLVVAAALVVYIATERQSVDVTGVHYEFLGTDASDCGWSNLTGLGVMSLNDATIKVSTPLTTPSNSGPCLISGVSAMTGGFAVENFTVPGHLGGGVGGTLTVTLTTPSTGFSGTLNLEVIVAIPGGMSP